MGRVLIIEDDPSVQSMLQIVLATEGYDTESILDGEAAVARLDGAPADLVLLDVMMPGVDGFALCRELADRDDPPGIVIISARDRDQDIRTGTEAGADHYLTKPFDPEALVQLVEDLAAGRR